MNLKGRSCCTSILLKSRGNHNNNNRSKKRVHGFRIRFRWVARTSRVPCLCLGDDRRGVLESGNVSLTICITFMSGSESLRFFTNCFFHFSELPGFGLAFDAAKRNGRFGRIRCQRRKEHCSRGKRRVFLERERGEYLHRKTVRVKVKGKVIPTSFLKIEGGRL